MGYESPNVILYDSSGNALAVQPGASIPASTPALLLAGTDGTNARYLSVDTSGRQVLVGAGTAGTPSGGVISIQGVSGGTSLPVSIATTVTTTNSSVSTTGSAVPASATFIGGSVTTAAPTYTTGNMGALSLTTTGALRIDGSAVTQPVSIAAPLPSGTNTIGNVNLNGLTFPFLTVGNLAAGAATAGNPLLMGASDGANIRYISSDTGGRLIARLGDGTNTAAIKGASTAAVATDPALVVAISPNNILSIGQTDTSVTGTLGALNTTVTITPSGKYTIGGTITGTWVGTITAQGTVDGTNWFTVRTANKSTNDIIQTYTANDSFEFYSVAGCIGLRLQMTAYTSGTATVTLTGTNLATDAFLNYSSTDGDAAPPLRYVNIATLSNDGTSHSLRNTNVPATGTEYALVTRSLIEAPLGSSSYPDQGNVVGSPADANIDAFGNLQTRGTILTDEGSFRDDFTGSALTTTLTGTLTFTNGSTTVTGTGSNFTGQIRTGQYIKKTADAETLYVQVASVDSATSLTLVTAYAGTTATAASVVSNWQTVTPSGGTITVTNSVMTLAAGTTASATGSLRSLGDYLPYNATFYISVSQRIANQTIYFGFQDVVGAATQQAIVQFTGTTNTTGSFITSFSAAAADTQTTAFTFPSGGNSSTQHAYKIDLSANQATLSVDGVVVAVNQLHLPSPYTSLFIDVGVINGGTAPGSSTSINVDNIFFENIDRIQIDNDFGGEPLYIQGGAPSGQLVQGNPVLVAGYDGVNTQTLRTSSTAGFNALVTNSLITDGTHGPAAVKAASTVVAATDAALVVQLSTNSPNSVQDRTAMTAGSQFGFPIMGQSGGVGRILSMNRLGYAIPGYQTLLASDVVEGTTVNSWLWTQSTTTMTIAQTTGVLTLNSGAITTINTDAIITTNKQFAPLQSAPVGCTFKALITQTTNAVNEIGFGAPSGVTAAVPNGAFFRISATGLIHTVISFNGAETVSASLGSIVTTSYYNFIVVMEDNGARFIMEDENGIPIVDTTVPYSLSVGQLAAVSHIPAFARVYVTGTAAGTAPQTKIASFQAYQYGINTTRPWSDQMGTSGRWANVNPTTFGQTLQLAAGAAPTTVTPTNTASSYTTLGGEYSINITASSENLLGVFGFQSPSPYALVITDLQFQPPLLTTSLGATINYQEWCLMVASSANPSTATGYRVPLGLFYLPASQAAPAVYNGQPIIKNFTTPIIVLPGQFLLVCVKQISGSAAGVSRGAIFLNGYFE